MNKFCNAFISYGRADSKAFATKLYDRLLKEGLKVWFDQNDIPLGVDFQNQIDDGIEKGHNFLFIIAPHSVNSPYCGKEIELALKRNKRIIPLLHVEQITQETWQQRNPKGTPQDWEAYQQKGLHSSFPNMHPAIGKINWVYFREGIDDFEQSFAGLIDLLKRHADYVEQHTQFLARALEWERHQKQTSYLLVGEERQQAEAWLKIRFKDEQPPCVPSDLHCEYITESIKNANNLMTQVFISYADEDRATMEKIRKSLRRESITVWTNTTDIQTGEAFEEAIKRGIEQADNVVYLLSPDSVMSDFARRELESALSLNKRIIPVLVREIPPEKVPSAVRDLHYIDLTDNVREEDYQLDESQLLKILHQDEAYYNEHKILLTKALKWKRQHENPSILLRGYNLRSAETWLKVANKRTLHPPILLMEEFIDESLRQPPAESLDVFISYSRADSDFARKLNDELQLQGKRTWFDQESIASGSNFAQEIRQGIKACDNFLFILSPRSVNSPYCADEVEYAASLNKRFVTVLHREVNSNELHPELAKVQWIDFNPNEKDFNANFRQLVRTLDTDREHLHNHTKWSQRAIEWEEKGKSADLLLRGSEFGIAENWLMEAEQQKKQPAATPLQKAFIESSQNAIAVAEKAEKRRQAEMLRLQEERAKEAEARLAEQKKSARRQKYFFIAIGITLMALVGAAGVVWVQRELFQDSQISSVSRFSLLLSKTDRTLDAMIEAIRAGKSLQERRFIPVQPETRNHVLTALQQAVYQYGFRERNRLVGHNYGVWGVRFSPDGKTVASASGDNTVKLWSLDGRELATLKGHNRQVNSVAWSPNGQTIATASNDQTAKLWNLDGKELATLNGHNHQVKSIDWSPDGQFLATASEDNTVRLWSGDGKLLKTFQGHNNAVYSISFSPDGQTIASAGGDNTVRLWSGDGKLLTTFQGHNDAVYSVSFSPDGQIIVSASKDETVRLWSRDGKLLKTFEGHNQPVNSVSFSPDGQTIASASLDKTVRLWNRDNATPQLALKGHEDQVNSVSFSPDGQTIASASLDKTVRLWNFSGKQLKTLRGHTNTVNHVSFSPDSKTIASTSADKTIKLWSVDGTVLNTLTGHTDVVRSVVWSPDGQTIASGSGDKTIKLWSVDGTELNTLTGHTDLVRSLSFSPDSKTIASTSWDTTVRLWNRDKTIPQLTLTGHDKPVNSVSFSPNGKMLASASDDKTIKLWSVNGKELNTLQDDDKVYSISFSPNGQTIASAGEDTTVKLWSVDQKRAKTLKGHSKQIYEVSFSPDGETIASGSWDKTVKLWNKKGEIVQTLEGHTNLVFSIAFSPDGKMLASASADTTVILWNLEDLTLDSLMQDACDWVGDYLKYNAPERDQHLCDNIEQ
ncbi:TIR domain-containing protein [Coleofasciculus sp. F4-SAH-05]|uniref:TIR domain-containing protein n=1 Tax=Coleofasciculus sp. F4-SAH-05 TaxID=3069525 RepID=UPI0032F9AAE0